MPAHISEPGVSGLKWIGSKHDNPVAAGLERASAVIVLNDPHTNYPIGILEGSLISAWRTAGVTCLAAEYLARRDFTDVALVGCGVIGRTQVTALLEQFPQIATVHLFDARPAAARALAELLGRQNAGVAVRIAAGAEEAVRAGEVVVPCTVTDRPYIPFGPAPLSATCRSWTCTRTSSSAPTRSSSTTGTSATARRSSSTSSCWTACSRATGCTPSWARS
jgi:ornithine cyclodeaminase